MSRSEIAIWTTPGEPPLRGVVLSRTSPRSPVLVEWESGRQEKVKANDPSVRYAFERSARLEWLTKPGLLDERLRTNPAGVIADVIRDEQERLTLATVKRKLTEVGVDPDAAGSAIRVARHAIKADPHIVVNGSWYQWSDVPVDPYADLRALPASDALERLVASSKLKPGPREALADAVKAAFV